MGTRLMRWLSAWNGTSSVIYALTVKYTLNIEDKKKVKYFIKGKEALEDEVDKGGQIYGNGRKLYLRWGAHNKAHRCWIINLHLKII